jgi:hypothetical protein
LDWGCWIGGIWVGCDWGKLAEGIGSEAHRSEVVGSARVRSGGLDRRYLDRLQFRSGEVSSEGFGMALDRLRSKVGNTSSSPCWKEFVLEFTLLSTSSSSSP